MKSDWTKQQDHLLKQAVKNFGIKWEPIRTFMKTNRTLNSLIKRWHCKLKFQQQMLAYQQNPANKVFSEQSLMKIKRSQENNQQHSEEKTIIWKKNWTERDDKKLKLLVVQSGVLNWTTLAVALQTQEDQIKLRWKKVVYPKMIKQSSKVGGALKWSSLQDKILNVGFKQNINWEEIYRIFLPQRTLGSLEARWRRIYKRFEVRQNVQNKYLARKQWLKRMGIMKNQQQNENNEQQKQQSESRKE